MNVKTLKRMSKRSVSVLLTVLMIISLFTVCMVGTTVTAAGAAGESIRGKTIMLKADGWNAGYVFIGKENYTSCYAMYGSNGEFTVKFPDDDWSDATGYFFSSADNNLSGKGTG